ncbi:hypothetical protein EFR84_09235 [Rhizobium chutanense]|uniref:Uncharacterized protein n=1 Tax=Rhizobium chutanense TaxID=2035448 RepID=A0A432P498_9HYPH|nr:hypothetical protein EFR84_09235 [Rhizobium chutanense]
MATGRSSEKQILGARRAVRFTQIAALAQLAGGGRGIERLPQTSSLLGGEGAGDSHVKIAAVPVCLASLLQGLPHSPSSQALSLGSTPAADGEASVDPRVKPWDDGEWGPLLPNAMSA